MDAASAAGVLTMPLAGELDKGRRRRLEQLLQLAGLYKGWNRRQLAEALDRDPTKLVPESGNPKLDLVVALSDLLDWPVDDVVGALWGDADRVADSDPAASFEALDDRMVSLHRAGKYREMLGLVAQLSAAATTARERAIARIRESGAWDGLGRYSKSIEALRSGLVESPIPRGARLVLESNLAVAYYSMNYAVEAKAIAKDLVEYLGEEPPTTEAERSSQAFAYAVSGQSSRLLLATDAHVGKRHAQRAVADLEKAEALFMAINADTNDAFYAAQARTCRTGALEAKIVLGQENPEAVVKMLTDDLDQVVDLETMTSGVWLESYCWSCVFGANIALRHLPDREMNRAVAIFTNKGYEIAEKLDNWALREKLFTLEFLQRQRLNDLVGSPLEWTIDGEEVRTIVGAMGRFPTFRQTGWDILNSARVVRQN
jgi:hypothetical protein